MGTMRTESPIMGGGAGRLSASASPPSTAAKLSPLTARFNSDRDVEAAIAIAHLSDGCRRRPSPQLKVSHVRTAVMPERFSHVQPVSHKRKYECEDTVAEDPLKRAIENERNYFDNVKRGRFQTTVELESATAVCDETGGRFVRTCRPHRHCGDHFHPDFSNAYTIVSPRRNAIDKGRPVNVIQRSSDMSCFPKSISPVNSCIPPSRCDYQYLENVEHFEQCRNTKNNADLTAFYRLGRDVASALTSPVRQQLPAVVSKYQQQQQPRRNYRDTRAIYVPPSSESASRQRRLRLLDSKTENKVRSGDFGSLKTLQLFYERFDRREPAGVEDDRPLMRERLGSITNCKLYRSIKVDRDLLQWKSADQETAMDLSTHGPRTRSTEAVDIQVSRFEPERIVPSLRRKSRSCCGTPTISCRQFTTSPLSKMSETPRSDSAEAFSSVRSKAESRLPLKKRRLLEVKNNDTDDDSSLVPVKTEVTSDSEMSEKADEELSVGDISLHDTIIQKDLPAVERIVSRMVRCRMSLDFYDSRRQTPLHIAVITNQPLVVRRLLMAGSSPNVVDDDRMTSIHHAAVLSSSECLQCLVDHSIIPLDFDAVAHNGFTALHLAVQHENVSSVSLLIGAGARVDVTDGVNGRTPLFFAVDQNNIEIVRILLARSSTQQSVNISPLPPPPLSTTNARCKAPDISGMNCVVTDVRG